MEVKKGSFKPLEEIQQYQEKRRKEELKEEMFGNSSVSIGKYFQMKSLEEN